MRISSVYSRTVLVFALLCLGISTADRTKRQIFETDNNNGSFISDCIRDKRPGRCIRVSTCTTLPRELSRNTLRQYFCGFERNEPKVCCPETRIEVLSGIRKVEETKPSFLPESCGVSLHTKNRIIGGKEAVSGSWPWMAVVIIRQSNGAMLHECGGALVTNRHVVTAAHCVVTKTGAKLLHPSKFRVRLGAHNLTIKNEPGSIDVNVQAVLQHERYIPRTNGNDIAVLKLSQPVNFTERIGPICLPYDSLQGEDLDKRSLFAIGYGSTKYKGNFSDVLMEASLDIVDQNTCREAYVRKARITNTHVCAGVLDGTRDTCQGDSGGPLMAVGENKNFYLVGVVSSGESCGKAGFPGVYTRITEYLDWLSKRLSD